MDRQTTNNTNTTALWSAFCNGGQEAFLELYEQYFSLLFTWGCRWVKEDTELVKDALHDFFIYLWEKKANLSRDVDVQNYLLTSFKRRLLRQQEARKEDTSLITDTPENEQERLDAEQFAINFEKIKQAMEVLTPGQREVITLRYFQDMSLQEIADLKQTSLRTVYNLMHRGLTTLKSEARKKNFIFLW